MTDLQNTHCSPCEHSCKAIRSRGSLCATELHLIIVLARNPSRIHKNQQASFSRVLDTRTTGNSSTNETSRTTRHVQTCSLAWLAYPATPTPRRVAWPSPVTADTKLIGKCLHESWTEWLSAATSAADSDVDIITPRGNGRTTRIRVKRLNRENCTRCEGRDEIFVTDWRTFTGLFAKEMFSRRQSAMASIMFPNVTEYNWTQVLVLPNTAMPCLKMPEGFAGCWRDNGVKMLVSNWDKRGYRVGILKTCLRLREQ